MRIRRTFHSTPEGKVGMLRDQPVFFVTSHGGLISGSHQPDFLTDYLRTIFETIGIKEAHLLCADGLGRGPEVVERVLAQVRIWIDQKLPVRELPARNVRAARGHDEGGAASVGLNQSVV